MKEMDYVVMGTVAQRIITARSARGKLRTPEALIFDNTDAALAFIRSSNQEGFRFSGQDLIDPEYRLVKYVYFVRPIGGGRFQPAGQDFGPPESVFEPGDIHTGGARDGKRESC